MRPSSRIHRTTFQKGASAICFALLLTGCSTEGDPAEVVPSTEPAGSAQAVARLRTLSESDVYGVCRIPGADGVVHRAVPELANERTSGGGGSSNGRPNLDCSWGTIAVDARRRAAALTLAMSDGDHLMADREGGHEELGMRTLGTVVIKVSVAKGASPAVRAAAPALADELINQTVAALFRP